MKVGEECDKLFFQLFSWIAFHMFSSRSISIFSSVCGLFSPCKTHCCCVWVVAKTLNLLLTPTFRPLTNSQQQLAGVNLCTLARRLRTHTLHAHVLGDRTSKTFEENLLASWIKKRNAFLSNFNFHFPVRPPKTTLMFSLCIICCIYTSLA